MEIALTPWCAVGVAVGDSQLKGASGGGLRRKTKLSVTVNPVTRRPIPPARYHHASNPGYMVTIYLSNSGVAATISGKRSKSLWRLGAALRPLLAKGQGHLIRSFHIHTIHIAKTSGQLSSSATPLPHEVGQRIRGQSEMAFAGMDNEAALFRHQGDETDIFLPRFYPARWNLNEFISFALGQHRQRA